MYPSTNYPLFFSADRLPLFFYSPFPPPVTYQNISIEVTGSKSIRSLPITQTEIPSLETQKRSRTIRRHQQRAPKKSRINIKNVIPNLVRKLLVFLTSENCWLLMLKMDPELS